MYHASFAGCSVFTLVICMPAITTGFQVVRREDEDVGNSGCKPKVANECMYTRWSLKQLKQLHNSRKPDAPGCCSCNPVHIIKTPSKMPGKPLFQNPAAVYAV